MKRSKCRRAFNQKSGPGGPFDFWCLYKCLFHHMYPALVLARVYCIWFNATDVEHFHTDHIFRGPLKFWNLSLKFWGLRVCNVDMFILSGIEFRIWKLILKNDIEYFSEEKIWDLLSVSFSPIFSGNFQVWRQQMSALVTQHIWADTSSDLFWEFPFSEII